MKIQGNSITFPKGSKPRAVSRAQRDVRDIYLNMVKMDLPRSAELVETSYTNQVKKQLGLDTLPTLYTYAIQSAAQAYGAAGHTLALIKTMYSMDLHLPTEALSVTELPDSDLAALRALNLPKLIFRAREYNVWVPKHKTVST